MKKIVSTYEELQAFTAPMLSNRNVCIDVRQLPEGYEIQWIELKQYTTHDGLQQLDEVWSTQDGTLHLIQDLSDDHCRNIVRMMLRQEREHVEALRNAMQDLGSRLEEVLGIPVDTVGLPTDTRPLDQQADDYFPESSLPNKPSIH